MSFINSFFLFALGAAALPVLFHLVRKMKAKKVAFSSLMFLKATPKELVRKRRLKDILLMAIRAGIFALLAFAFARPFIPEERIPFISQEQTQSVVFLIDASYSMQMDDAFEQARQAALDRITTAGPEDEFAVVAFSNEATQLTPLSSDREIHTSVLRNTLQVSNRTTDFYKPLRLAEEILQDARNEEKVVVLLSDLQRNGWTGALENWKLPPAVVFDPVKLATRHDEADNGYFEAFNLSQKRTGPQVALRYDARVGSAGALRDREKPVTLLVDGEGAERQDAPPVASAQVTFQQIAGREGAFQGSLGLEADALEVDNVHYFSYGVAGRPSLLVVDDAPRGRERDAFFLERAFDLREAALYDFTVGGRDRLTRSGLRSHAVVFLANLPSLTNSQLDAVTGYVEDGGSVVLSFGPRSDLAALGGNLRALGLGAVRDRITARSVQAQDAIIGEVDLRHPIFSVFSASGTGAILRPTFRQYVQLEPDTAAVVVASYDTGDPFLLERRLGQGKVLAYTSTFNTNWTDFPINEMYLPFVYELAKYGVRSNERRQAFTVGEVVAWDARPGEEWEVQAPGERLFKVPVDDFGKAFFRETEVPGNYVAARGREQYFFSVNVDPRESALETRDQDETYAAIIGPSENVATTPEQAALMIVEDEEKQQKLWRYLLLLVLGLFALETFLANRKPEVGRSRGIHVKR